MVKPDTRLVSVLRDTLGLTGVRTGCRQGACGSCTVLVDDEVVLACLVLAIRVEGKSVITIEGLKNDSELDPLQQAFVDNNAIQCGFCTSGMVMAAKSLLDKNPKPDKEEIHEAIGEMSAAVPVMDR